LGIVLSARTTKRTVHSQETKSHCGKPHEMWFALEGDQVGEAA
jgi:hypothetical protein